MTDYLDDRVSGDRYRAVEAERDRLKNLVEDQASAIDVAGREIAFKEDDGFYRLYFPELKALLGRLEAAEEVIKECLDHRGMSLIGSDDWHEAYEAWRKAKGE